ncbi:UDP-N-acetylmuramoyl-tripeptide--D-alanyl-D-alanine ligase [Flavobacterium frigidarium]|uniref:UDP-N-acetylmuramoyl-tripeptide--D-alanyl-D- alanine ligase n=1 Tax=Flavobacterium frigidarium TaxID=99286 RepID=UPI0030DD69B0|tara:strand:- start:1650 stop:2933 length:1284 start_codon:yes stop_codon:yes gene_type:complete
MNIKEIHSLFLQCDSISTDTRKIEPNSFFVALKGDNFDANAFAEQAIALGAKYVLIDDESSKISSQTILVKNCLETLQKLAKYHRGYLKIPIIALTGSNGKTTTKELINVVLSQKFNTKATVGNLNNHIGVPLTLLSFNETTEIGIVEMGANHKKEIEFLCSLATPDYGYITNFGKAHLEGFGGIEGVIQGKSEMYNYLQANNKVAFINLDDKIQVERTKNIRNYSYGINNLKADINIYAISADPLVTVSVLDKTISSNLIGLYNATNINAAITIGTYFGVNSNQIKIALENYTPANNRSQLINKESNKIILDAYNANPSSMAVAITNFAQLEDKNKIMILGDMFELGEESQIEHQLIVQKAQEAIDIKCHFIGSLFYKCRKSFLSLHFHETFEDFENYFKEIKITDSTLLIKGSRGMKLERVLNIL